MANDNLIAQLDSLRDTYSQKQRAATALQAAFKAVTDSQSKAQRVLRDFSTQEVGIAVNGAQDAFSRTRLKEEAIDPLLPELRREVKNLAGLTSALRDAAAALRSEPVDVVRLDKAVTQLQAARQQNVLDLLPELGQELELAQRALGDEFGVRLRDALAEQGVQIGGRAPRFEIGRFELEANFAKRFITLRYGKDVVVPRAPITVEAAVRAWQGANKAIAGRAVDGRAWIAQFYEAYQNARRKKGNNPSRVNIVDVYIEQIILRQSRAFSADPSKRTFTEYSRAQFIYDFYEFTNRQRQQVDGQVARAHGATKSQTDKPNQSMWIVEGDGPYDGRYIADVEFERA